MPFLFANVDEAIAVMNSEWGQNWAKASEKNGTIVLATGACGFRNLTNSKRVVKTPADLNGIKLRVPSWEVTIKTMEALGVSCTSIAYNETYPKSDLHSTHNLIMGHWFLDCLFSEAS